MMQQIRQLVTAALGCACMAVSSLAFAQVSTDQIAIGGVGPGCTDEYVRSIYGDPSQSAQMTSDTGVQYTTWQYGGSFIVGFLDRDHTAAYVTCTADNLATPGGVTVGMTADVLGNVYGSADQIYGYQDKSLYVYSDDHGNSLSFDVQNFYIVSINVRAAS